MSKSIHAEGTAFVIADDVPVEDLGDGIRRQILAYAPELMLARVFFEAGAVGAMHSHPHSQIAYVGAGRFRVTIDGEERELAAGDSYFAASQLEHGAVCLEAGVLLDIFTPMREDFLGEGS